MHSLYKHGSFKVYKSQLNEKNEDLPNVDIQ